MAAPLDPSAYPTMSVVLVTPGGFAAVRETVASLQAQTVRDVLEIVIAAPSAAGVAPEQVTMDGFHSWRIAEIGADATPSRGAAAGVRVSSAPIVAFAEEHSFPEPSWAEALIRAHEGPWAVVGPAIVDANPRSRTGAADYLLTHGRFAPVGQGHEADEVPAHNSAYKRQVLLALGDDLERSMAAETVLWWRLREQGRRLYFEPAARTRHLSVASWRHWLPSRLHQAHVFGATRSHAWPRWQRLVYASGAPLIPPLRMWRLLRALRRSEHSWRALARALPLIALGLLVEAAGEAWGYLRGTGEADQRLARYELERRLFASDRGPGAPAA